MRHGGAGMRHKRMKREIGCKTENRACGACGERFRPKRSWQKQCSQKCRQRIYPAEKDSGCRVLRGVSQAFVNYLDCRIPAGLLVNVLGFRPWRTSLDQSSKPLMSNPLHGLMASNSAIPIPSNRNAFGSG